MIVDYCFVGYCYSIDMIDSGYLSAVRCIYDLLQYEEKNEEEKWVVFIV